MLVESFEMNVFKNFHINKNSIRKTIKTKYLIYQEKQKRKAMNE